MVRAKAIFSQNDLGNMNTVHWTVFIERKRAASIQSSFE